MRVKKNAARGEGGCEIDKTVVVVALEADILVGRRPRVGDLVFMEIGCRGDMGGALPGQAQEGSHIQHVGGEDEARFPIQLVELFRQGGRPAVHPPLPVPPFQGKNADVVPAMGPVSFGPFLVASGQEWLNEENIHVNGLLNSRFGYKPSNCFLYLY